MADNCVYGYIDQNAIVHAVRERLEQQKRASDQNWEREVNQVPWGMAASQQPRPLMSMEIPSLATSASTARKVTPIETMFDNADQNTVFNTVREERRDWASDQDWEREASQFPWGWTTSQRPTPLMTKKIAMPSTAVTARKMKPSQTRTLEEWRKAQQAAIRLKGNPSSTSAIIENRSSTSTTAAEKSLPPSTAIERTIRTQNKSQRKKARKAAKKLMGNPSSTSAIIENCSSKSKEPFGPKNKPLCVCQVTVETVYWNHQLIKLHCPECTPDGQLTKDMLGRCMKYKDFQQHQSKLLKQGPSVDLDMVLDTKLTSTTPRKNSPSIPTTAIEKPLPTSSAIETTSETNESYKVFGPKIKPLCVCQVTVETVYQPRIHLHCPECKPDGHLTKEPYGRSMKYKDFRQHKSKLFEQGPSIDLDLVLETKLTSLLQPVESSITPDKNCLSKLFPRKEIHCAMIGDNSLDEELSYELQCKILNVSYQRSLAFRTSLPVYAMKERILQMINTNQVSLVSGETGSGKTTQVAQFILDHHIQQNKGSTCRIVCTQPRRISAISVAERVSEERAERIGKSTGYRVRLDACPPREQGSIMFCTPGVLLRMIIEDPFVSSVSHIIIDEVHERDILTDFLLIVVKQSLLLHTRLKVILMSATINTEKFSEYFYNCPVVDVPGRTHPVQEVFLEQLLGMLDLKPLPPNLTKMKHQRRTPKKDNCKGYFHYVNMIKGHVLSPKDTMRLLTMDFSTIPHDLIVETASYICQRTPPDEAILVFLPGWKDIERQMMKFRVDPRFRSREDFLILPIHSKLDTAFQKEVFVKPPPRVRKIIIGTNIVETSITIDDIVHIIDSGKAKENTYDADMGFSILSCGWVSKASLTQRLGRAGRVKPGKCYRLFTKQHLKFFKEYRTPDIMVKPLRSLCLMAKVLQVGKVWPFLLKAVSPPPHIAFKTAVKELIQMKALDERENLTVLGYCLAHLPVEPQLGRMMIFGALFSCLDPVLTIATIVEGRETSALLMSDEYGYFSTGSHFSNRDDPYRFKLQKRGKDHHAKEFKSDHISMMKEFLEWEKLEGDAEAQASYAQACSLQNDVLRMKLVAKNQFTQRLHSLGVITEREAKAPLCNIYSDNMPLLKAVLCAGLYPNVAIVKPFLHEEKRKLKFKQLKSREKDPESICSRDIVPAFFTEAQKEKIGIVPQLHIHPTSSAQKHLDKSTQFLLYTELVKTDIKYYIFDVTTVSPYSMLLFGGHLEHSSGNITVDGLRFPGSQKTLKIFLDVRQQLDRILTQKLKKNKNELSTADQEKDGQILESIIDIISAEDIQPVREEVCSGIPFKAPRLSLNENGRCDDDDEEPTNYASCGANDEEPANYSWCGANDEEPTNYTWCGAD